MNKLTGGDVVAAIVLLGATAFGGYVWFGYKQNVAIEKLLRPLVPQDYVTLDKTLSSSNTNDDATILDNIIAPNLFCLRMDLEDKVSGRRSKGYFVVDIAKKQASQISEAAAADCIKP